MPDTNQSGTAELIIDGRSYQLPIIEGMEGDRAIDIRGLLKSTGYTVFDTGYKNSASCSSTITYLDGNKGLLLYRGYAIEDLAARCLF
ncbi:MAG: citrate/2-methylcitrate synthase, partial [Desulfobulbus sp.]|nr:citrate/2-methylcitrate synthase [Desulfobulbus sp.]